MLLQVIADRLMFHIERARPGSVNRPVVLDTVQSPQVEVKVPRSPIVAAPLHAWPLQ